jgi:hypothetical protein
MGFLGVPLYAVGFDGGDMFAAGAAQDVDFPVVGADVQMEGVVFAGAASAEGDWVVVIRHGFRLPF